MKIAMDVAETHWEGGVSQNVDIVLSFCFILFRRTLKIIQILTKVTRFLP